MQEFHHRGVRQEYCLPLKVSCVCAMVSRLIFQYPDFAMVEDGFCCFVKMRACKDDWVCIGHCALLYWACGWQFKGLLLFVKGER